jgi:hypothetical protein
MEFGFQGYNEDEDEDDNSGIQFFDNGTAASSHTLLDERDEMGWDEKLVRGPTPSTTSISEVLWFWWLIVSICYSFLCVYICAWHLGAFAVGR